MYNSAVLPHIRSVHTDAFWRRELEHVFTKRYLRNYIFNDNKTKNDEHRFEFRFVPWYFIGSREYGHAKMHGLNVRIVFQLQPNFVTGNRHILSKNLIVFAFIIFQQLYHSINNRFSKFAFVKVVLGEPEFMVRTHCRTLLRLIFETILRQLYLIYREI